MSLASLEHDEVEQFTREFETLFNVGDAAGMAAFYAEDARLLAEHADLVRGRDAIERFWREAISRARRGTDGRWRLAVDSSSPSP
jgi:ketosteroid isomerase-like protein